MNAPNQKILITGGSSGIGLELSKQLLLRGHEVIICGSTPEKLVKAQAALPRLMTFCCDLSQAAECQRLADWIKTAHPDLSILVNNAAIVHKEHFLHGANMPAKAEREMQVNFLAPVRLIDALFPVVGRNPGATVVNVTTGLIYAPKADYPFYNSTKAALHAFSQVLRIQAANTAVKIIEVMFPAVVTPWHQGQPPKIAISPEEAVATMLVGWDKGQEEIRVKGVRLLYVLARLAPRLALRKINALTS